jgi:bacillithiol system protein YtxJ
MATIASIRTDEDWRRFQQAPGPAVLLKHSTTCPISARAHAAFTAWAASLPESAARLGLVRVIEERPLSLKIAAATGVTHQSPQVLLLRDGRVVWHASHFAITEEALAAAMADPDTAVSHSTTLVEAQAEWRRLGDRP